MHSFLLRKLGEEIRKIGFFLYGTFLKFVEKKSYHDTGH